MAWFRSRYIEHLERENARLVDENHKLMNAILPRLGYNPLDPIERKAPPEKRPRRLTPLQWAAKKMRESRGIPTEVVLQNVPRPTREEANVQPTKSA